MKYRIIVSLVVIVLMAWVVIINQDNDVQPETVPAAATPNYNL